MKTIALIEDDESIGSLLTEALTEEGYAVRRACSGTEALMLLEREQPDLDFLPTGQCLQIASQKVPRPARMALYSLSATAGLSLAGCFFFPRKDINLISLLVL